VEAAARILESSGRSGFTTNEVAERAGVSIGSLYQYFPNKDAITLALIERDLTALVVEVEHIASTASATSSLEALVHAACRHQLQRVRLAALLEEEEHRLAASGDLEALDQRLHSAASKCVRHHAQASVHAGPWIDDVLAIILGMVNGAGGRGEDDVDDLAARVMRAVTGYLATV
jgi:AcrR family transcriptional regulator